MSDLCASLGSGSCSVSGNSTDISSASSMQSLNLAGSSSESPSQSVNPSGSQSMQQQQVVENRKTHSQLQAYVEQIVLPQLDSLTIDDASPQNVLMLLTKIENLQEVLGKAINLQNSQNYRNFQSYPAIAANANGLPSLLELLNTSFLHTGNQPPPLTALSALESSLETCWSPSLSARGLGIGAEGTTSGQVDNDENSYLEGAARMNRNEASHCDPICTWSGHLPPRNYENATYSCKVFVGGLPWDITDLLLTKAFGQFGSMKLERPMDRTKGCVYIIFDNANHVKSLLQACTFDSSNGGSWYYKISSGCMRPKKVEVIPSMLSDCKYVCPPTQHLDPQKTVFVGALPGKLTAEQLALIMKDLFGEVLYAGIHTDRFKYPKGSGRVTFNNNHSCMKAVAAAVVEIKTPKFSKKVQVKPFLEDVVCASCRVQQGPLYCHDPSCFKYFCRSCWDQQHNSGLYKHHRPLMRH